MRSSIESPEQYRAYWRLIQKKQGYDPFIQKNPRAYDFPSHNDNGLVQPLLKRYLEGLH